MHFNMFLYNRGPSALCDPPMTALILSTCKSSEFKAGAPQNPLSVLCLFYPNETDDRNLFVTRNEKKGNNQLHQRVFSRGALWRILCKSDLLGSEGQTDTER